MNSHIRQHGQISKSDLIYIKLIKGLKVERIFCRNTNTYGKIIKVRE